MTDLKNEKTIYFVRHGQSEDNSAPVFQSPDSPLSAKGREQAISIAKRVSKLAFETLISSPFLRATQTAEAIAALTGKKPELSDLFVERIKPTNINGKPYTDKNASTVWREWEMSLFTPGMRVDDGENFDDITMRADNALSFLERRKEKSLVVVTHGYFLRTIIARVLLGDSITSEQFKNFQSVARMENTGLTVIKYQSGFEEKSAWRLWIYNDHAHLAD